MNSVKRMSAWWPKDMDILEGGVGAVDAQEVADIRRRAAELNGDGGGEVS